MVTRLAIETDRDDARHMAALERIAARLAELDPWDRDPATEIRRRRLLELRGFYRDRLGIADDGSESRMLTDARIASSDALLARTRRTLGLPAEGPVDWQAAREAFRALGPDGPFIWDDPDE